MAIDFDKELRRAVDTGKVEFGYRKAEKNALTGKGKLLVVSTGLPKRRKEHLSHLAGLSGIPFYEAKKNPLNLGSVCGKPFPVTAMVVLEQGKSKVLSVKPQKKQ